MKKAAAEKKARPLTEIKTLKDKKSINYHDFPFKFGEHMIGEVGASYLAKITLWNAFNPNKLRTTERIIERYDLDGNLIEKTNITRKLPPDWRAAEAFLKLYPEEF